MNIIVELIYSLVLAVTLLFILKNINKLIGVRGVLILYLLIFIGIGLYIVAMETLLSSHQKSMLHIIVCVLFITAVYILFEVVFHKKKQNQTDNFNVSNCVKTEKNNENSLDSNISANQTSSISLDKQPLKFPNAAKLFSLELMKRVYSGFLNAGIIHKELTFIDFQKQINEKELGVNLNGPSLYFFHFQIKKNTNTVTLKEFVTFFKDSNGNEFNYNVVRNGSQQKEPLHKDLILSLFEINNMTKE